MKTLLLFGAIALSFGLSAQTNNYSLEFDGIDQYIELNNGYDTPEKTIYISLKLDSYPIGDLGFLYNAISENNVVAGLNQIAIRQDSTLGFQVGSNNNQGGPNTIIPLDQWVNISLSIGSNYSLMYVDGSLVDSVTTSSTPGNSTFDIITFGCFRSNQATIRFFDGLINRIALWDYALDSVEINNYIICPPIGTEIGLSGYWDFEEGTGSIATDITTNVNDGTLTNGPTWSTNVPSYNCNAGIEELANSKKELVKIIDLMGRETEFKPNTPLIFVYSDGSTERVMEVED